jgi:hypothetical protein
MITYGLFRYSLGDEELIFEHESEQVVAEYAVSISLESMDLSVGYYNYRLEKLIDGEKTCTGFRFFNNGFEFTYDIVKAIFDYK